MIGSAAPIRGDRERGPVDEDLDNSEEPRIVRLVDDLLEEALERHATHLHVEPAGPSGPVPIRFRVNGSFQAAEVRGPARGLVARLKILARLDISERRRPQSGPMEWLRNGEIMRACVVTLPTLGGEEDVVVRFEPPRRLRDLSELDLSPQNLERLEAVVARRSGLLLVVGPNGSGKSTLMHAMLAELDASSLSLYAAEYAVEYRIPGVPNLPVSACGPTMGDVMRYCVRADADAVLAEELAGFDEVQLAVRESLGRRLIIGGMHTATAAGTVRRLLDIDGRLALSLSSALCAIVAVRLVPRLCAECRRAYRPAREELDSLRTLCGPEGWNKVAPVGDVGLYRREGCEHCDEIGYEDVVGIHELLVCTPALASLIARSASEAEIAAQAVADGMTTLAQDAVAKAVDGTIDVPQMVAAMNF